MHVIGTAGHVDHGKSTLTYALTGINPDRLEEEQRREMTIDLGFAWLDLPNGERVGIVDVPGHRDFIENMLAGVGGIDAAVLVIAADEGVMPQTREHLAILDLLAVPTGLIALTKTDLITDPSWLELIQLDIMETVQGTILDGQPMIPVSARTGAGLDQLVTALTDLLNQQPPRPDVGNPRLPIDRVFTISGFGVVVTGTLSGGSLAVGQEVEIQPSGVRARIRGLQSHEESIEQAEPGQRVAVNLRGVEKSDLARGQVLGLPNAWVPTTLIDAWLRYLPAAQRPLQHDDPVKLFIGAAEVTGHVRVLDREQVNPGEQSWIQIRLERPVVAAYGDRYILRRVSPPETIGGGIILDTAPGQRWKRFRPDVIQRFETLYEGDPLAVGLLELAQLRGPVRSESVNPALLKSKHIKKMDEWAIHKDSWARLVEKTTRILTNFHEAEPTRQGMPREALRSRLKLEPDAFDVIVNALVKADQIAVDGGTVRLPTHGVRFTSAQEDSIREFWRLVERTPNTPPTVGQARELMGDKPLHSLIEHGDLIRISDDVILPPTVLRDWIAFARETLEHGETLTVASVRDHFQTTRRYALDFLERLDALGITRRKGDERVLGSGKWDKLLS